MENKLSYITEIVKKELSKSSHDMDHVMRVYKICEYLSEFEQGVHKEVLLTSAILHDIARVKEDEDKTRKIKHEVLGCDMAQNILKNLSYSDEFIRKVKYCILTHRFRGDNKPETIEAKILFDADKLDSIGAIGIARCYIHVGEFGGNIYLDKPLEEYKKENIMENGRIKDFKKHSPNFEYELKLKNIPDRLNTIKAKELASKRIKFMENYFSQLKEEFIL